MRERYGEYELLAQFARGGMAEIFLARRIGVEGFERELVVKRMLPKLAVDESCVRMFLDEARLTAGLQHPNIAQVIDLGRVDDTYFIAMELVDGPDLRTMFKDAIAKDIALPVPLCAWIVARVAEGLHYAHTRADPATGEPLKIVHRDVNHANVLLSRHGGVKIVDFGVAHAENRSVETGIGGLKGKMGYIAPEQCIGDPFDHRADVFALGVVLYELLTRKALFYRKSDLETLEKIVYEDPPPPSTQVEGLGDGLDEIILSALAKKPDDRLQSAGEMARRLDVWALQQGGGSRSDLAAWIDKHAKPLCPTERIPRERRTSRSAIKRWTTGEYAEMRSDRSPGSGHLSSSGRRRLELLDGPTTSRDNPLLGGRKRERASRSNLPKSRSTFVGHDTDMAKIAAHFASEARLITLFGTAGVGKSRVAIEYARRHLESQTDASVWWCHCGEADGLDGTISAMAAALGVPLVGAATRDAAIEQLGHALTGRKRALVVLDDFDKMVDYVEESIGVWLAMAPQARFLITSRSLLRVADEAAIEIAPLGIPQIDAATGDTDAEKLFVDRARRVRPNFAPTERDRIAIAAIVRRLDGIPLAIELAAARISVLAPDELLKRLAQRFEILRGGVRGQTGRNKTLRSAIDWSWKSLTHAEQDALVQATVFRGGFTLAAAEQVLHVDSPDEMVIDVVQSLRDRSMLRVLGQPGFGSDMRFSLFESIAAYATEKAWSARQIERADARHEAYYLELCERLSAKIPTHDGVDARRLMAPEVDNLIAVHERALARQPLGQEDVEIALRIACALFPLLIERGPVSVLWRLLGEALEAAGKVPIGQTWLGLGLAAYGEVLARTGDPRKGIVMAREALTIGRRSDDPALQARALIVVAICHWLVDEHDAAMKASIEARGFGKRLGDLELETRTLNVIGCVHFSLGDRSKSADCLSACVNTARQIGHLYVEAMAQSNVGCIHADLGHLDAAETCFRQALDDCLRLRNRRGVGVNRCELAVVAQERGDVLSARRHFKRAMTALRDVGDRQRLAYAQYYMGCFELESGAYPQASAQLRAAEAFFEQGGNDRSRAMCLAMLAYLDARASGGHYSGRLLAEAQRIAEAQADPPLFIVVAAMRGATEAVDAIRTSDPHASRVLERARVRIEHARQPWPPDERYPDGRPPVVQWSREARFAVRVLERLLKST